MTKLPLNFGLRSKRFRASSSRTLGREQLYVGFVYIQYNTIQYNVLYFERVNTLYQLFWTVFSCSLAILRNSQLKLYSGPIMVKITVGHWKEKNESINMSRVEICSLAYEGKFKELKEKIDLKPSLATKLDEVRLW